MKTYFGVAAAVAALVNIGSAAELPQAVCLVEVCFGYFLFVIFFILHLLII